MRVGDCVLVATPDPATQAVCSSVLQEYGYIVKQSATFRDAITLFIDQPCSLVIISTELGAQQGLDLVRSLREYKADVLFILVGESSSQLVLNALRNGVFDYLPTPVSSGDVQAAISRLLAPGIDTNKSESSQSLASIYLNHAALIQSENLNAQGRLAANIAHEINNPLTPILGMAEMLLDDFPVGHPKREYLEAIIASAYRIRDTVRSLLDFAQPPSQQRALLDLAALIRGVQLLVAQQLRAQSIDVYIQAPQSLLQINANHAQLKQAMFLLVENAREAMPKGGKLHITLSSSSSRSLSFGDELEEAIIEISDTGDGIDKDRLPYIFEPFYSTKSEVTGVGMGLAIAKSIINIHGGAIEVETTPGQGATFRVILPLARVSQRELAAGC